jgi:hypothetical protein
MTLTATAVVFGLLLVMSLKANWVRPIGAFVCVIFGLVLGASAAGPAVNGAMADLGASIWQTLQGM